MKNPRLSLLIFVTVLVLGFTAGLFVGRNYSGAAMTVTVPDEILLPPPSAATLPPEEIEKTGDILFPIDINNASIAELMALPGIGEGLAGQIILYRESNGSFSHVEELINVPGIGENRLESILSLITVGGKS